MTGVGQVHLGVGVRQTVGDQLQLQVLIVLTGTPYSTVIKVRLHVNHLPFLAHFWCESVSGHLPVSTLQALSPADGGTVPS